MIVLYDGNTLPDFDAGDALQDVLAHADNSPYREDAHKLAMCVTGGHGRTLEVSSGFFIERFANAPIGKLLKRLNVRLATPSNGMTGRPLYTPQAWGGR